MNGQSFQNGGCHRPWVASNLYVEIISDDASILVGGVGVATSPPDAA